MRSLTPSFLARLLQCATVLEAAKRVQQPQRSRCLPYVATAIHRFRLAQNPVFVGGNPSAKALAQNAGTFAADLWR